jgi:hypothetical protein
MLVIDTMRRFCETCFIDSGKFIFPSQANCDGLLTLVF